MLAPVPVPPQPVPGRQTRRVDEDDDIQLTIAIAAEDGSSALERDGLLWRLDDVVTAALSTFVTNGYLVQGSAAPEEVRLVVMAPRLADADVLGAVSDAVTDLLAEPDLAGWGPFSIVATEEPDEFDDDDGELVADLDAMDGFGDDEDDDVLDLVGVGEPGADDAAALRLSRDSRWVRGLDQNWLTELDIESDDPDERARALVESEYVAGALFQAGAIVVDLLFEDLAVLTRAGEGATVAGLADEVFLALEGLPPRFADRYDEAFARAMVVAVADVTRRLVAGWEPLGCVAEELGLRLLLDQAEVQLEDAEVPVGAGWRAWLEEYLFEDPDHEMLYEPAVDEDGDPPEGPGGVPMRFEAWFTPFGSGRPLPPYLLSWAAPGEVLDLTGMDEVDLDAPELDAPHDEPQDQDGPAD